MVISICFLFKIKISDTAVCLYCPPTKLDIFGHAFFNTRPQYCAICLIRDEPFKKCKNRETWFQPNIRLLWTYHLSTDYNDTRFLYATWLNFTYKTNFFLLNWIIRILKSVQHEPKFDAVNESILVGDFFATTQLD